MAIPVPPKKQDMYLEDLAELSAVSESFLLKLASSINEINRNYQEPLGSKVFAFITEALYQSECDNRWILADGRDITSSDLGQLLLNRGIKTGTVYAPDMRGMVPIGLNNGRNDGKQNTVTPAMVLGGFMENGIKAHKHNIRGGGGAGSTKMYFPHNEDLGQGPDNFWFTNNLSNSVTLPFGQSQNTVNSMGGNWFIKIWHRPQE